MANTFERTGFLSVLGGMNGALSPSLLADSQYAFGLNVSSRGGLLHTRPRWYRMWHYIPDGRFQGAFIYRSRYQTYLACVVDGVLYLINVDDGTRWRCTSFPTIDFERAYFCQVDRFLVVQNGLLRPTENWPIIMDDFLVVDNGSVQILQTVGEETSWVRLRNAEDYEAKRVPIGTYMAYGHGRLFVVVSRLWDNGLETGYEGWVSVGPDSYFVAGDIIKADNADEVLAFTEADYLAEGGAFSLPTESGKIKGFQFLRNAATGTGVGELVAFGERGVSAFAVGASRTQWKDVSMAQVLFTGSGAASGEAIIPINDDLAYRANDGLRFIKYTAYQTGSSSGSLSNLPQSMEVSSILNIDSAYYIERASLSLADERLLLTVIGNRVLSGDNYINFFTGLVSLDTYVVGATGSSASLMARSNPVYDGLWTGPMILQTLSVPFSTGVFPGVIATSEGRNELWILTDAYTYDGEADKPLCRVVTKSYGFKDPLEPKEFKYAEMWVSGLRGDVDFKLYWKPDDYGLWSSTNTVSIRAPETAGHLHHRWCLRFAVPPDRRYYDEATNRDTRRGFSFDFCLEWQGLAASEKTVFYTNAQPSSLPNLGCAAESVIVLTASNSAGEDLDMTEYELTPLDPLTDPGQIQAPQRPEGEDLIFWNGDTYYYYADPHDGDTQLVVAETGETIDPIPGGGGATIVGSTTVGIGSPGSSSGSTLPVPAPPIPPDPAAPPADAEAPATGGWLVASQGEISEPTEEKTEPTDPTPQPSPTRLGCLQWYANASGAVSGDAAPYTASVQMCLVEPSAVSGSYYKVSVAANSPTVGTVTNPWGDTILGPFDASVTNCANFTFTIDTEPTADISYTVTVKSWANATGAGDPYCTKTATLTFTQAVAQPVITLPSAITLSFVEGATGAVSEAMSITNSGEAASNLNWAGQLKILDSEIASALTATPAVGGPIPGGGVVDASAVTVTGHATGVAAGTYDAQIIVRDTVFTEVAHAVMPVTFEVSPVADFPGTMYRWLRAYPPAVFGGSSATLNETLPGSLIHYSNICAYVDDGVHATGWYVAVHHHASGYSFCGPVSDNFADVIDKLYTWPSANSIYYDHFITEFSTNVWTGAWPGTWIGPGAEPTAITLTEGF